ncbi:hypothetical protein llap_22363 [Limosa lapponica baueri]|uniref:Uncharacterized protein n=1 Tax=Limosa lapponica baueri TaxID=1758121 RepID=A0A2I0T0K6_LIMLA|nr:hypothetical protein llap_22363 [Limosa lapponica baueri]
MPSRMTTISKSSFSSWCRETSQKGLRSSISWLMMRGETRKRRSSPVSKPTLRSVWSRGMNSPSCVCLDLMSLARMEASTMCESRRSPTRNIRQSRSSRRDTTAWEEKTKVSARLLGWEIFTNMQPTMKALTMEPRMAWSSSSTMPSGHLSVMTRWP